MITLCDELTPGGPAWLWAGVGGTGRPLMSSWGWGKWQEGGDAVPCGVPTDCTSLLSDEHLGRFQTLVTVLEETVIARLLLNHFVEYVSHRSISICFTHSMLRSSTHPASHLFIYLSTHLLIN